MQFTALPNPNIPVLLRPIVAADLPVWFDYLSLPDVHEHTSWKPEAPSQLEHYDSDRAQHTPSSPFRLAIADRSHGRMLGSIGFHTVSPENRTAELAYDLSPPAWGQGIASAMAKILVDLGPRPRGPAARAGHGAEQQHTFHEGAGALRLRARGPAAQLSPGPGPAGRLLDVCPRRAPCCGLMPRGTYAV